MANTTKHTASLEENLAKLEGMVEALSGEDISLEEAFTAYKDGMELLKQCNDQIDRVEKKVLKLSEGGKLEEL